MTTVAQPRTRKIHRVEGCGGLRLHVREWGRADGPLWADDVAAIIEQLGLDRPGVGGLVPCQGTFASLGDPD